MESGARIGGQELLSYEKTFVDLTLPTNLYVRIVLPTREVYTGDLFTEEQGGTWTSFSPSSIASAGAGTLYLPRKHSWGRLIRKFSIARKRKRTYIFHH